MELNEVFLEGQGCVCKFLYVLNLRLQGVKIVLVSFEDGLCVGIDLFWVIQCSVFEFMD